MKAFNLYVGNLVRKLGYRIEREYRVPQSTLNLLELGSAYLFTQRSDMSVVQIGAFDGELSDPLRPFLESTSCRVLIVEPQYHPFCSVEIKYQNRPNAFFENSAISEADGKIPMYLPEDEDFSTKASLRKEHLSNFGLALSKANKIEVNSITVRSLLQKYNNFRIIDILQIDTEGYDFNILMQFFAEKIEPSIINLETFHLNRSDRIKLREELSRREYFYQDYGMDTFCIKAKELIIRNETGMSSK